MKIFQDLFRYIKEGTWQECAQKNLGCRPLWIDTNGFIQPRGSEVLQSLLLLINSCSKQMLRVDEKRSLIAQNPVCNLLALRENMEHLLASLNRKETYFTFCLAKDNRAVNLIYNRPYAAAADKIQYLEVMQNISLDGTIQTLFIQSE